MFESGKERFHEDAFDLTAGQTFRNARELAEVEVVGVACVLFNLDAPDRFALGRVGQVNEEEFVPPALAQHLRGQLRHVVGRRRDEYRGFLFLHPTQKWAEHPG